MLAALGAPRVGDTLHGGRPGRFFLEHAWLSFPLPTGQRLVCCDANAPVFSGEKRDRGEGLGACGYSAAWHIRGVRSSPTATRGHPPRGPHLAMFAHPAPEAIHQQVRHRKPCEAGRMAVQHNEA